MAKRVVIWTRTADIQFIGILEYWVEHNTSNRYSKKLLNLVTERTQDFAKSPFIYKATNFKNTRVSSLGNFSIYYKTTNTSIIITAFWDNRQDPKKLLQILKQDN